MATDWRKPGIIEYKTNNSEIKRIPYPPILERRIPQILGSCDGLVCLHLGGLSRRMATYNPSTGKYFWVKSRLKDYYSVHCSWFGHHPSSGEYVLVLGDSCRGEVGVYKFNRRSNLKKVHSTSCRINPEGVFGYEERVRTFLHGALHWPVVCSFGYTIFVYHLDDNKHFEIALPVQSGSILRGFKLGVAEGCLFAFFKAFNYAAGVFELWIMKEYKLQQSWTKYANIRLLENRVVAPLAFFPNGNHLILHPNNKSEFINYTFHDNKALLLINSKHDCEAIIMCADSLVSPKIVGT